jgi:hypothetical protein
MYPSHTIKEKADMELIRQNIGNIIVGAVVFGAAALAAARLIINARKGKGCSCGCENCPRRG